ncbi:melatonin-related receptor isoform X2 [Monodelphis domestica]|uniref:Melatonin-related receptor n=1 Tax=Monodelphis domestica TaxID=13616 RepID=A0A5F8GJ49_MONDO|nr:melatonin-related receptor isoform X2 [Monodelphis domestica]
MRKLRPTRSRDSSSVTCLGSDRATTTMEAAHNDTTTIPDWWQPKILRPPNVFLSSFLSLLLSFTIVMDLVGNSFVIAAVTKNERLRNLGNIFVISLSVADMLVAVYPYPMTLIAILNNGWTMGKLHCQLSGLITSISAVSSVFNIMVIALNRYCYICHSLLYEKIFTGRNSILILIVTWLMTMLALIPNYYVTTVQYNPQVYTCSFVYTSSAIYAFGVMALHFLIPLTVVAFCYLRIWILVIQVNHRVKVTKPKFMLVDVRNFMTMFLVFVLFALCWGPLNFIKLARVFDPLGIGPSIPEWMYIGSYYLAYFNSCVNAMIYGTLNQNFRKEYQRIVRNTKESAYYFVVDLQEQIHEMRMRRKPTYAGARRIQGDTYL